MKASSGSPNTPIQLTHHVCTLHTRKTQQRVHCKVHSIEVVIKTQRRHRQQHQILCHKTVLSQLHRRQRHHICLPMQCCNKQDGVHEMRPRAALVEQLVDPLPTMLLLGLDETQLAMSTVTPSAVWASGPCAGIEWRSCQHSSYACNATQGSV